MARPRNDIRPGQPLYEEEQRYLVYLANEYTRERICRCEKVSKRVVDRVLNNVFTKLGVQSSSGAVAQGFTTGQLSEEDIIPKAHRRKRYTILEPEESDALTWSGYGMGLRGIASMMSTEPNTVNQLLASARGKLGVKTNEDAHRIAKVEGFLNREILQAM